MSIKSRQDKITEATAGTIVLAVAECNGKTVPVEFEVPGTEYKYYVVVSCEEKKSFVEDVSFWEYKTTCRKRELKALPHCQGNSNNSICYHTLAALHKKAQRQGLEVWFKESFHDAFLLSNFGGQLVKITSTHGEGVAWGVVKKRSLKERVDLIRPVEGGVE